MQKIIALFPGQGSQCVGMGKDFYDETDEAKELFQKANDALSFDLTDLCFNGPIEKLTQTEFVQSAILTVSTICFRSYIKKHATDCEILAAAGHSLGEYSALVAGEAISFEDAVVLVNKRGKYMQEAVPAGQGKMVAVLGKNIEDIKATLDQVLTNDETISVQIANVNAAGQVVVSGASEAVDEFLKCLGTAKTVTLAVSAPFHSKLMAPAAERLAFDLDKLSISDAKFPIYCNVTAHPVQKSEEIRQALKDQVCGSVLWLDCVNNMLKSFGPQCAIEFGSGNVLSNLMKRINKEVPRLNVGKLTDL